MPGLLSISSVPPLWTMKPCAVDRPSPVPTPAALVVKNDSMQSAAT